METFRDLPRQTRPLVRTHLLNPTKIRKSHIIIHRSRIESFQGCRYTFEAPAADIKMGLSVNFHVPTCLVFFLFSHSRFHNFEFNELKVPF